MHDEVVWLKKKVIALTMELNQARDSLAQKKSGPRMRDRVRPLLFKFHPDRAGETVAANEVVIELNRLAEELT